MSRKLDDLDLIALRELGKSSQKVQDLIQEKNNTLIELEQKATFRFKKLDPAPSPNNDKRFLKTHSKVVLPREVVLKEKKNIEKGYNDQIKEAMIEKAKETDQDYYVSPLQELPAKDTAILNEKGVEAYKENLSEKEVEPEKRIAFDLDDESHFNVQLQSYRFMHNSKDMDLDTSKTLDPADDFE